MKKLITLLMAATMALSLCACSGTNAETNKVNIDIKTTLITEEWKDVFGIYDTMTFNEDGTGKYILNNSEVDINWTVKENCLVIEDSSYGGEMPFDVIVENDTVKLVKQSGGAIYVPIDEYEAVRATTNILVDEVSVEITNNDGVVETLSSDNLCDIYSKNNIKFDDKYLGAPITVVSKIEKVGSRTLDASGHLMMAYVDLEGGWRIEASSTDVVADFDIGDTVKVSGNIWSAFMKPVEIYIINDHTTTIEAYQAE